MLQRWFSDYNIAVFTLVFMSVQFVAWEGVAVSTPKVAFMAITPLLLLIKSPYLSKAVILSVIFWIVTVGMTVFQFRETRMSTFYYTALFLSTFCLYYNLVYYNKVFSLTDFIKIIRIVIYAYAIVLALQQICLIIGLKSVPIINLMGGLGRGYLKSSSLAIEPSHTARIMTVYFYAFLKSTELQNGSPLSVKDLWSEYKWVIIAFVYIMLGCGSGTSFVGLAIIALYFLKKEYVIWIVMGAFIIYMIIPFIHYEPLDRAMNVFNAALSMDSELMTRTDNSAASRVNILIDTYNNFDLNDEKLWFGYGIDKGAKSGIVTGMSDYGLISYIFKLGLFFGCCFLGLFSLEILMFILLFSLNIGNIAYGWAALMVFSTIKYFYSNDYSSEEEEEDEDETEDEESIEAKMTNN